MHHYCSIAREPVQDYKWLPVLPRPPQPEEAVGEVEDSMDDSSREQYQFRYLGDGGDDDGDGDMDLRIHRVVGVAYRASGISKIRSYMRCDKIFTTLRKNRIETNLNVPLSQNIQNRLYHKIIYCPKITSNDSDFDFDKKKKQNKNNRILHIILYFPMECFQ